MVQFFCDYGENILIGEDVCINYNGVTFDDNLIENRAGLYADWRELATITAGAAIAVALGCTISPNRCCASDWLGSRSLTHGLPAHCGDLFIHSRPLCRSNCGITERRSFDTSRNHIVSNDFPRCALPVQPTSE